MKYKTILTFLRIFDNKNNDRDEAWLSEVLDRYTRYQLRRLGLSDE